MRRGEELEGEQRGRNPPIDVDDCHGGARLQHGVQGGFPQASATVADGGRHADDGGPDQARPDRRQRPLAAGEDEVDPGMGPLETSDRLGDPVEPGDADVVRLDGRRSRREEDARASSAMGTSAVPAVTRPTMPWGEAPSEVPRSRHTRPPASDSRGRAPNRPSRSRRLDCEGVGRETTAPRPSVRSFRRIARRWRSSFPSPRMTSGAPVRRWRPVSRRAIRPTRVSGGARRRRAVGEGDTADHPGRPI